METFFVEERRKKIVEILKRDKRIMVKDLANYFSVSEDLIRKDIKQLEKEDILTKTYGGAILKTKMSVLAPYKERAKEIEKKLPLAKEAASLVEDGDTIFIEASSYTILMLEFLKDKKDLTIVTNAIHRILDILPTAFVIQTGGWIHKKDEATYGNLALDTIRKIYYDKCFLSLSGVTSSWNVTSSIEESASLKKAVIENSNESILLVSWEKWNHHGIFHVCHLNEIDTVITDVNNPKINGFLEENSIRNVIVKGCSNE